MGIEEDSLRALKELNQTIATLTRSLGQMGGSRQSFGQTTRQTSSPRTRQTSVDDEDTLLRRGTEAFRNAKKAYKGYDQAAKRFLQASGNLTNELTDANDDLGALRDSWSHSAESMHSMKERIDKYGNTQASMNNQATLLVAGMSRFTDNMAKTTKAQSLLYSEQLTFINGFKDFERAAYFDELAKSLGGLSNAAKSRLKLIDESTGAMRTDLGVEDFKRVRASIGELEASFKQVLTGTDFKSFGELTSAGRFNASPGDMSPEEATRAAMGQDSASINRDAVARMAAMLQERGIHNPQIEAHRVLDENGNIKGNLNDVDFEGLAKEIASIEASMGKAAEGLDKNVANFKTGLNRFVGSLQNAQGRAGLFDSMKEMTVNFLATGAAFKFAKDKIVKAWDEISDFNIAQIPASYLEVNKASVSLGLSFKDTVKLMDENKRMLAIYGPEQFQSSMGKLQKTFQKYGYTMEQAAEIVAPAREAAVASGVNVGDPDKFNDYTQKMMDQFQQVSGMVSISAKEFAELNKTLFQSEGTFQTMLGMDTQRRQAYSDELVQLRTKYVAQGLEIQQAQDLVKAQQEQQRAKLGDRMGDGAKLMQQAMLAGMGSDQAMEVYRLATKGRRNSDEQERFTELTGQIGEAYEQKTNDAYGANGDGALGDIYNDMGHDLQTSGQVSQIQRDGEKIQMAKEAGAQVTPDQQKRASTAAKGNENVAVLGQAINQASSLINNSFIGAIVGSTAALVAFGFQLSRLSLMMGGPAGILNAVKNVAGAGLGKISGVAGRIFGRVAGTTAGGVAEGAAAGIGGAGAGIAGAAEGAAAGAASGGIRSAAGSFLSNNAGMLGKAAGIFGGLIAAYQGFSDINDAEDQRQKGEITDKQATVKKAGAVGAVGGSLSAGLIGAGIGQVLIPIPGVGAVIGGAVGAALGGWLGKSGTEAIADAVVSDKDSSTPDATSTSTSSKPTPGTPVNSGQAQVQAPGNTTTDSATGAQTQGINSQTQNGQTALNVQDANALIQLQAIAASLVEAVGYLSQMIDQKTASQMPSIMTTPPPNNMNQFPSAFQFTTGRSTI